MDSNLFKKPKQLEVVSSPEKEGVTVCERDPLPEDQIEKLSKEDTGVKDLLAAGQTPPPNRMSSWLLSLMVHCFLMILLALIIIAPKIGPMNINAQFSDELGDQLEVFTKDEGNINPVDAEDYQIDIPEEFKIDEYILPEKIKDPVITNTATQTFDQSRIEMKDMLKGRTDPGLKNDLIAKYGGNRLTEDSVKLGLRWLKKQQGKDGRWSLKGPYTNGLTVYMPENHIAATAMALLAFQGNGNTRSRGEYQKEVKLGWTWLLKQQNQDGLFFKEVDGTTSARFYTHAIALMALSELIVLEKIEGKDNTDLRSMVVRGIDYLKLYQNAELGGWRYEPGIDSDLSVTGWCLMALQTARMAEIEVPESMLQKISGFLDKVALEEGSQYVYTLPVATQSVRPSMIATGLLCRLYLGWDRNNPAVQKGAELLVTEKNIIQFPKQDEENKEKRKDDTINVYGWYSAAMMLKHLGPYHKCWQKWNAAMCRELPTHQVPENEPEGGSWNPQMDEYYFGGGRLYVTTLSILCLEVYYRHLAIFH